MSVKVDKRGKITIPKVIRDKHGFTKGVSLRINDYDGNKITIEPINVCSACGKALPDELAERDACAGCTPVAREIKKIY